MQCALYDELLLLQSSLQEKSATYQFLLSIIHVQYPSSLWVILEGTRSRRKCLEEQERSEGWGCGHCCIVWHRMLRVVLCRRDRWEGIHFHWLLCMRCACSTLSGGPLKFHRSEIVSFLLLTSLLYQLIHPLCSDSSYADFLFHLLRNHSQLE